MPSVSELRAARVARFCVHPEEEEEEEAPPQVTASLAKYNFPKFTVDFGSRDDMLKKTVPQLVSQQNFDVNAIVNGLGRSVETQGTDPRLFEQMMAGLLAKKITDIHDFEVFVLHVGLQESDVGQRTQESRDLFVVDKSPVKSKSQLMKCLREMRDHYHLIMMDPAVLWNMVVLYGCFRELSDREKLLDLCPAGEYRDIGEFINKHISTYDWGSHCSVPVPVPAPAPVPAPKKKPVKVEGPITWNLPATQQYKFPPLVVKDNRAELLRQMIPVVVAQKKFSKAGIINGMSTSVNTSRSDMTLLRSMLQEMSKTKIMGIVELKRFILKFGFTEEEVQQRVQKSVNFFKRQHPPVSQKHQIVDILFRIRSSHFLVLADMKEFWTSLVTEGCFRKLTKRDELLALIEYGKYKDISEFISHRVGSYNWKQHCPSWTETVPEASSEANRRQTMTTEMRDNEYKCTVCLDPITAKCQFYQCEGCYTVTHLDCLRDWLAASHRSECPMCRKQFVERDLKFTCWCRKVASPRHDLLFPGSCGKSCGKIIPGTNDTCAIKCHPGPHSKQ